MKEFALSTLKEDVGRILKGFVFWPGGVEHDSCTGSFEETPGHAEVALLHLGMSASEGDLIQANLTAVNWNF